MATIPVSDSGKKRLYAHLAATGKTYHGSITELVDELSHRPLPVILATARSPCVPRS